MHSDGFYRVNMARLGVMLLPTALRGAVMTSVARLLLSPLAALAVELNKYRGERLQEIRTTGQVRILRNTLNDRLDMAERRIEIADGEDGVATYARQRGTMPVLFIRSRDSDRKTYVMKRGLTNGDVGFIVKLPPDVHDDPKKYADASALVKKHHLAGTTYEIIKNQ